MSKINAADICASLAGTDLNAALQAGVTAGSDENPDNIRDKAAKIVSKLLELSPEEQQIALMSNPELSKIQSMIREGASLEGILDAFKISGDPSIVFPRSTEILAAGGGGGGMLSAEIKPSGNGGGGGGNYRD